MATARIQRIHEIFEEALAREASQRGEYLTGAGAGDEDLRAEVEALLLHDAEAAPEFLQPPAAPP